VLGSCRVLEVFKTCMLFHCCGSPIFTHLAGRTSVWKALSPEVLKAAFNVDPETEKLFRSKRTSDAIFFPSPS
jgi:hypothetical protein